MLANPKRTKDEIVQWIRSYFESNGPGCDAVIGISGGKDSSVVAALCVEALGKERVVGVMMPNGEQPDLDDSKQLIEFLGIRYAYTDISKAVSAVSDQVALNMNVSDQTRINLPPRIRMATLYAISQSLPHGGRVANTCNRSEDYVGYSTKFGDSAGDFSPLANLMVHEVIQIGYELLLPIPTVKLSLLIWFREMIGSDVVLLAGWISSLRTIPKNSTTSSRTLRSLWRKSSLRKLWRYPLAR